MALTGDIGRSISPRQKSRRCSVKITVRRNARWPICGTSGLGLSLMWQIETQLCACTARKIGAFPGAIPGRKVLLHHGERVESGTVSPSAKGESEAID